MAANSPESCESDRAAHSWLKRMINKYLTTDFIIFCGYVLITFINAWDFTDRVEDGGDYYGLHDAESWVYIKYAHFIMYLLYDLNENRYWTFFVIHIAFAVSFYYVAKRLKMESLWIFAILLTLPVLRYGVMDYGTRAFSLPALVMTWIYYFKRRDKKKSYYAISILGMFTKEFCLYVNMFFIIETLLQGIDFKNIKDIFKDLKGRILRTLRSNTFEVVLCISYFIYRSIFSTALGGLNPFDYGMFNFGSEGDRIGIIYLLTNPKVWVVLTFIYGMLFLVLIKYPSLKIYAMIAFVTVFSSMFGLIWEIEKIGCIFMIIAFELLTPRIWTNQDKKIVKDIDKESS